MIDRQALDYIYYYWTLKRKSGFNKPLINARSDNPESNKNQDEIDQEKMKMFIQLRQDLERVKNYVA